jgi:cysteine-rich repeat protein
MPNRALFALAYITLVAPLAGCGDNIGLQLTSDARIDAPISRCGDVVVAGAEECDDGNTDPDDGCSPTCQLECGDGVLGAAELCDTAIATGNPGACPTEATCTDSDPCTIAIVSGAGCQVTCEFAPITGPADGDGCCPSGQNATTDNDCDPVCGNAVVETPEVCDTGIPTGDFGACPTACDDGEDCTADVLVSPGTCDAACTFTPITLPADGDMCCPPGANPTTDSDCSKSCGDGVVTPPETCDTAIPTGPGSCPTSCNDGDVCTTDDLVNAGTCRAACTATPIAPGPDDGCCPAGADLGDDPDCPPSCGDGVITPPETCEDGNTTSGDGCSSTCRLEPVAFRMSDLDLRDPHTFADVPILGCTDVTNLSIFGQNGVNPTIQINIQNDEDGDGLLDLSIAQTFSPLVQTAGSSTMTDLVFPDCTEPMSSTSCTLPAGATHTLATADNFGAPMVCLPAEPGTTNGSYTPAIVFPTAPAGGTCYVAAAGTVTFTLSGLPITLEDARIAGEWFGAPATEIRDGLIRGFLSQATADATIIPEGTTGIASIDGEPLSSLFRGGAGNCSQPAPATGDRDTYTPPGGSPTTGWFLYLQFTAVRVPYTEL